MKKLILILTILAFAAPALAEVSITDAATTSIGGSPFSPSQKVTIEAASTVIAYTATSCHLSGTKEYATAGGSVATGVDASTILDKAIPDQGTNTTCNPTSPGTAGSMPSGFN